MTRAEQGQNHLPKYFNHCNLNVLFMTSLAHKTVIEISIGSKVAINVINALFVYVQQCAAFLAFGMVKRFPMGPFAVRELEMFEFEYTLWPNPMAFH